MKHGVFYVRFTFEKKSKQNKVCKKPRKNVMPNQFLRKVGKEGFSYLLARIYIFITRKKNRFFGSFFVKEKGKIKTRAEITLVFAFYNR